MCRCFVPPTSEFGIACLARMVYNTDTRVYTGSRRMSYVQFELLVFLHLFAVGDTNRRERERAPKSVMAKCSCMRLGVLSSVPHMGGLLFPFIDQGQGGLST